MKIKLVATVSFLCISIINNTYSQRWLPVGGGVSGTVYDMEVFNNELYLGGSFSKAGTTQANTIAKWDGNTWNSITSGTDGSVNSFAVFQNELYVGGYYSLAGGLNASNISKWTGTQWKTLGTGTFEWQGVLAVAVFQNTVYIGGEFISASGNPTNHIAKWSGTQWAIVPGTGVDFDGIVNALTVYNSNLYVGGKFVDAGGVTGVNNVSKFTGSSWSALSTGINSPLSSVSTFFSFDNKLYTGGSFTQAGGKNAKNVALWSGTTWDSLGSGVNGTAWCFATIDNDLYMGGNFSLSGADTVRNIARWDNGKWVEVAGGTNDAVYCMQVYNDELYIGGNFNRDGAGVDTINRFAKLCLPPLANFESNYDLELNVYFYDSSKKATSYLWLFGDGDSSIEINPVHRYPADGKYIATLITNNECGSDTIFKEVIAIFEIGIKNIRYSSTSEIIIYQTDNEVIIKSKHIKFNQLFTLFDLTGKKIIDGKSEGESFRISKVGLPKGAYVLRVKNSSEESREIKVLIQ